MAADDISADVIIRSARQEDIPGINCLAEEAQFFRSKETLSAIMEYVGEENFIVAEHLGQLIGCRVAVLLNESTAFVGYFIVTKKYRGTKVAKRIARRILDIVGERNLLLWSVVERVHTNIKFGMKLASGNFQSIMVCAGKIDISKLRTCEESERATHPPIKILQKSDVDFDSLFAYDTSIHGFPRRKCLEIWLTKPTSTTLVAVAHDGAVKGYGVIQDAPHYFHLAPLYAESSAAMIALLKALLETIPEGAEVEFFENPACSTAAKVLQDNKNSLAQLSEMKLMLSKENVVMPDPERVFGVAHPILPV
ncbi:uncharacterized protein LOC106180959 [Lingula anatina]|uniref:Uncharacterized protein LOC106180959 n=1 Tax=Lingula anatina TaxID=7574 RepID=A0A1S3KD97_LINAN|nr:uncharacterized protein LOC106180959 [Lingula anatina]|eukprot:XP_013420598.1 uncharacterized protein LOC106180959 [Lingula anatina]